jgi:hypothetical protein
MELLESWRLSLLTILHLRRILIRRIDDDVCWGNTSRETSEVLWFCPIFESRYLSFRWEDWSETINIIRQWLKLLLLDISLRLYDSILKIRLVWLDLLRNLCKRDIRVCLYDSVRFQIFIGWLFLDTHITILGSFYCNLLGITTCNLFSIPWKPFIRRLKPSMKVLMWFNLLPMGSKC